MTKFSVVQKGLSTFLSRLLVMKAGGLDALEVGPLPPLAFPRDHPSSAPLFHK